MYQYQLSCSEIYLMDLNRKSSLLAYFCYDGIHNIDILKFQYGTPTGANWFWDF